MKSNEVSLSEIIKEPSRWTGTFSTRGVLYGGVDRCWLAENDADFTAGRRIELPEGKQLMELLSRALPVCGGECAIIIAACETKLELDRGVIVSLSECDLRDEDGFSLHIERCGAGRLQWKQTRYYLKVKSLKPVPGEPSLVYRELNEFRREMRKVEIYATGVVGYASSTEAVNSTGLSTETILPLPQHTASPEIFSDPDFEPSEISKEEFEEVWARR